MSADVIARLESLLSRVVARRAEPRVAAPVAAPAIVAAPAPKAIEPEAPRAELRRPEAPKPEAATVEALRASASREGYGRLLLGMIAYHQGETDEARRELGAFLARNDVTEPARTLTLREELRRARVALARITSS